MWNVWPEVIKEYLGACTAAAESDALFNKFRRNQSYVKILEHVGYQHGLEYIDAIKKEIGDAGISRDGDKWKAGDAFGGPKQNFFSAVGSISPSTLRYARIAYDIKKCFGDIADKSICEIGSGYGGQVRMLSALFGCDDFTIIDLLPPIQLAKKYLEKYQIYPMCYCSDMISTIQIEPDIVISNYAFSELDSDEQIVYYNNVIRRAKCGYMLYNKTRGSLEIKTMQKMLKNSIIIPEGISGSRSEILIWGEHGLGNISEG